MADLISELIVSMDVCARGTQSPGRVLDRLRLLICTLVVPKTGVERVFEGLPDLAAQAR